MGRMKLEGSMRAPLADITQGSNGDFRTTPGWDAVIGLGTPKGQALLAVLSEVSA